MDKLVRLKTYLGQKLLTDLVICDDVDMKECFIKKEILENGTYIELFYLAA